MHAIYAVHTHNGGNLTLPDERYRALLLAERFLLDLQDPAAIPRIPRTVREHAGMVLRHYPGQYYISELARRSPDIIAEEIEPVHRFVMSGTEEKDK